VKDSIKNVLLFMREQHYDVPFIARYRSYEYRRGLEEEDIWTIFQLEQEFGRYRAQYQQIHNQFARIHRALTEAEDPHLQGDIEDLRKYWE
jgi:transcriptional accessory protein Tex/SPT6